MDDTRLDTLLRHSAPAVVPEHSGIEATVLALVAETKVKARPVRRRRRALWVAAIPAVPVLALGLTAGIQDRLAPDLTIPITYTTDTGVPVSCSVFVFNGEISWVEVSFTAVNYLSKQNWSGIGQRIYEQALIEEANLTRLADEGNLSVSLDGENPPTAAVIETMAWNIAEGKLIDSTVPTKPGDHWGGDSDCSGQLH
ncbi:MAG: hypothetical protein IT190_07010 [Microbacteriaceae bacterium]|nr:hypothetical protein [Microbacteriaceae bacterium]